MRLTVGVQGLNGSKFLKSLRFAAEGLPGPCMSYLFMTEPYNSLVLRERNLDIIPM